MHSVEVSDRKQWSWLDKHYGVGSSIWYSRDKGNFVDFSSIKVLSVGFSGVRKLGFCERTDFLISSSSPRLL